MFSRAANLRGSVERNSNIYTKIWENLRIKIDIIDN